MEWLMGKARGVSRGLMSASTSSANATTTSSSPAAEGAQSAPLPLPPYLKADFLRQQLCLVVAGNKPVDFPFLVEPEHPLEENEWIAVHTIGLVENLCSIFDPLYELCLCRIEQQSPINYTASCQTKKPVIMRQAISALLAECNDAIQSARIFPVKQGQAFSPTALRSEASRICRKLLLCIVHIYTAHVEHLEQLDLVAHMNTITKHFFAFTERFKLLQTDEGEPDYRVVSVLNGFHRRLLETPAPNVLAVAETAESIIIKSATSGSEEKPGYSPLTSPPSSEPESEFVAGASPSQDATKEQHT